MSNTTSTTLPTTNNELAELQPEMETLSAAQAEQAHGGLLPAVQPSPLVPAVQLTGGYVNPGTIAGAFDAFRN